MVTWRWNAMGGVNILEWTVNPFQSSQISKLQDFYGLSFEDMFNKDIMVIKWVTAEDLEYIENNRETEYAKKSTIWFEMRDVINDDKFKQLQQFYGFTMEQTQNTDELIKLWLSNKDILYITGKDLDKKEKGWVVQSVKSNEDIDKVQAEQSGDIGGIELSDEINELREQHKKEFGKYPSSKMRLETLKAKLWVTKN